MRNYSFSTILLLCAALLAIDVLSFYGLSRLVFDLISSKFQVVITLLFWLFTIGLISGILLLKYRIEYVHPKRKQLLISNLYGLTVSSFIPKIIFVLFVLVILISKHFFVPGTWLLALPYVVLVSGFLPFFVIVYAIFKARYHFKIYELPLQFNQLPKAFSGLKIVHISDLHLGSFNFKYKILERAVKLINELEADIIFFTGDIVNNFAWELTGWEDVLCKLKAPHGKFAVLGNHDYGDYCQWGQPENKKENFKAIKSFFEEIDFNLLLNEASILKSKDSEMAIVGVENWGNPPFKQYGNLQEALKTVSAVPFKILLSHDPSHWSEEVIDKTDIALTLSGHTHGMQAGVNLRNKSWSPIKYKYKHWAGLYEYENQFLYVNRGLGWMGFPGRLGMRPEITLFTLN